MHSTSKITLMAAGHAPRWPSHAKAAAFALAIALCGVGALPGDVRADEAEQRARVVTGTVQELDRQHMKITLKTDLEKNVFFEVVRPDLLREIETGDRLTAHLNDEGKADKVTKLAVPELPAEPVPNAAR
jgi:hypothetical protein